MITTIAQYAAAARQRPRFQRNANVIPNQWMPVFTNVFGGTPAGPATEGTGTNTTSGIVPVAGNTGYPTLNAFAAGQGGILTRVEFGCSAVPAAWSMRFALFDRLWVGGLYPFNANVILSGQPSFAGRLPGGSYNGLELWWANQGNGASYTTNGVVTVGYTNQDGVTGRSAAITTLVNANHAAVQFPLQAGDSGVQRVDSVVGTVATAGSGVVMILRRLWSGWNTIPTIVDAHDLLRAGLAEVYDTSALYPLVQNYQGNPTGYFELEAEIAVG